jgi:putative ATP-dependent endonuclease of OLD family
VKASGRHPQIPAPEPKRRSAAAITDGSGIIGHADASRSESTRNARPHDKHARGCATRQAADEKHSEQSETRKMKFSKLFIKNFRSIGPQGLTITFPGAKNVMAIVGPNAAGKTNVLDALGVVLGMFPFSKFSPEESDFFKRDLNGEIVIELFLNPTMKERDVYQKEFEIAGFRYRAARYVKGEKRGVLHTEHYCFDAKGQSLVKPLRLYKKKTQADEAVDNAPRPILVSDQSWKLGELFFLDAPSLERFFDKTTGWSPLARLFEIYREDFEAEHNQYCLDGRAEVPSREAFKESCERLADILRTAKLVEIENGLSARLEAYSGIHTDRPLHVEFGLPSHREMFERWVELRVSEHADFPPLPVDGIGSGYRALLRLAVLETLLELKHSDREIVLLVEEPEIYLHVHLRRYFYGVLKRMAEKGHQIIYVTHDPEFVDLAQPHEIIRLHRTTGNPTHAKQVGAASQFNFPRMEQRVRRMGNSEIVFAQHAILTEGQDDQGVIEELLARTGVDPNSRSISVVNCDGATQIKDYVRLCSELGIDFYVVHDQDDETDASVKKRNDLIVRAVQQAGPTSPSHHVYEPDLEATMGAVKKQHNLGQLLAILGNKDYPNIAKDHPDLVKPVHEFLISRGLLRPKAAPAAPVAVPAAAAAPAKVARPKEGTK